MTFPNFNEEKKLWQKGYQVVVGLDEAGRGPLAGPVVAGAVFILNSEFLISNKTRILSLKNVFEKLSHSKFNQNSIFKIKNLKINDSKKLSEKQREECYEILTNNESVVWGVGIVSEKIIDEINILEATKLAMQKAIKNLEKKYSTNLEASEFMLYPRVVDFLLLDGNFKIPTSILQKSIIKGDQKVFSISCASIIAKLTRDRIMQKMHKKYPEYGFDKHKGYGTATHIKNIKTFGACKIHRKTFYPISGLVKN